MKEHCVRVYKKNSLGAQNAVGAEGWGKNLGWSLIYSIALKHRTSQWRLLMTLAQNNFSQKKRKLASYRDVKNNLMSNKTLGNKAL